MPTSLNDTKKPARKTVIVVQWKDDSSYQAFTSLKHFTDNVPGYSMETLRNHVSRKKKPYEDDKMIMQKIEFYPPK